jgi:DNA-binding Lrp family transcriptional regulator
MVHAPKRHFVRDDASIDQFDLRILDALQRKGRLTNQELADIVGLSASQCSRRRGTLEAKGLIKGYRAEIAAEELGLGVTVFTHVSLSRHNPGNAQRFKDFVNRMDFVLEAYALTGDFDYLVKMVTPDLKTLSQLINDQLLAHESVENVRSTIVLDTIKSGARLPLVWLRPQS